MTDDLITFGRPLEPAEPRSTVPDWKQASPEWIDRALQAALAQPSGGWVVAAGSRRLGRRPVRARIAGRDFVLWRSGDDIVAGPDECPHLGASLSEGRCVQGQVVCPWHGLRLGTKAHGSWQPLTTYDDGVLVWLQLPELLAPGEQPTPAPLVPTRPTRHLDAVMWKEARCDPEDILANRLDPWHGAHYHPHSFGRLAVIEQNEADITVRVVYRIVGRLGMEVDARFHCPDPRSIVMTIVAGEGTGSVVETHAVPMEPGRTAVVEATLATSERSEFWTFVGPLRGLLRPLVRRAAHRLWVEDAAYAERRFQLRQRGASGQGPSPPM